MLQRLALVLLIAIATAAIVAIGVAIFGVFFWNAG